MANKRAIICALPLLAGALLMLGTSVFKDQTVFFWGTAIILFLSALVLVLRASTRISYLRILIYIAIVVVSYNVLLLALFQFL